MAFANCPLDPMTRTEFFLIDKSSLCIDLVKNAIYLSANKFNRGIYEKAMSVIFTHSDSQHKRICPVGQEDVFLGGVSGAAAHQRVPER